jgi:hypothetical protein
MSAIMVAVEFLRPLDSIILDFRLNEPMEMFLFAVISPNTMNLFCLHTLGVHLKIVCEKKPSTAIYDIKH